MPPAAQTDSPTGAEAFARYWLTALDYAYQTGNTESFRQLGACGTCRALSDGIDHLYQEGGHFEGGGFKPVKLSVSDYRPSKSAKVAVFYSRELRRAVHGSGDVEEAPAAARLGFLLNLTRSHTGWVVVTAQAAEEK